MFEVIAKLPNEGILLIEANVMREIALFKQNTPNATESAGVLIGEYRDNQHIRIVDATRPSEYDKSTRFSFSRQSHHHQQSVLSAWRSSGKTQTWVGEWHTHPENHPRPSQKDMGGWKKSLPLRPMVLLIQGRVSYWLGVSTGLNIMKISEGTPST